MVHVPTCPVALWEENMLCSISQMYLATKFFSSLSSWSIPHVTLWNTVVNRLEVLFPSLEEPQEMVKVGISPLRSRRTMTEGNPYKWYLCLGFRFLPWLLPELWQVNPLTAVVLGYGALVHASTSPGFPFSQVLLTCKGEQWVSLVNPEMGMVLLAASKLPPFLLF